jgi:hypothetical protein
MKTNKVFILILILLTVASCEEEIDLVSDKFEESMVVEGMITNKPGPYTVRISKTAPVDKPEYNPYSGCIVIIRDNSGNSENLTEVSPGVYKTSETGMQGQAGISYSLEIHTPEGKVYATDYQEIKQPVAIDTVYANVEYTEELAGNNPVPGYRFYLSTETANNNDTYFVWMFEETYEYTADYQLASTLYMGQWEYNFDPDTLYRCWRSRMLNNVFTEQTTNLSVPKITDKSLFFIDNKTKRLQIRYSIQARQYVVNRDTYFFWDNIKDRLSGGNFIQLEQPFQVESNVYNVNNNEESVLGYFTVASLSEKRIFIDPSIPINHDKCFIDTELDYIYQMSMHEKLYFAGNGMVDKYCVDCREKGGKTTEPEFW